MIALASPPFRKATNALAAASSGARLQEHRLLVDGGVERLWRHPARPAANAHDLRQREEPEFRRAGVDELVGLGDRGPRDQLGLQRLDRRPAAAWPDRRAAVGRDLGIGDGDLLERSVLSTAPRLSTSPGVFE
jgi:hypothetical protein